MIQDVVDFMDYLKIQKAHIGGYSMGGATTAGLLKVAPERFITASVMGIGIKETPEWVGKGPTDPQPTRQLACTLPPTPAGNRRRTSLHARTARHAERPRARRMPIRKSI